MGLTPFFSAFVSAERFYEFSEWITYLAIPALFGRLVSVPGYRPDVFFYRVYF